MSEMMQHFEASMTSSSDVKKNLKYPAIDNLNTNGRLISHEARKYPHSKMRLRSFGACHLLSTLEIRPKKATMTGDWVYVEGSESGKKQTVAAVNTVTLFGIIKTFKPPVERNSGLWLDDFLFLSSHVCEL